MRREMGRGGVKNLVSKSNDQSVFSQVRFSLCVVRRVGKGTECRWALTFFALKEEGVKIEVGRPM